MWIDLNCDVGEGCGSDDELMKYISSANIACGFHAGDADTIARTVDLAIENGVAIGAHPGYRNRAGFGRSEQDLSSAELNDLIREQLEIIAEAAGRAGTRLCHVKPHGALYNRSAADARTAAAIADAVARFDENLVLFGLAGSFSIAKAKDVGLRTSSEAFCDRTYRADGSLTSRLLANALISDPQAAAEQVLQIIDTGGVTTVDGDSVSIRADTFCIHGDGPRAVEFARGIHRLLLNKNIEIRPKYV